MRSHKRHMTHYPGLGDPALPPGVTINFTLSTDTQGRLSQQSVNFAGSEAIISYRYY